MDKKEFISYNFNSCKILVKKKERESVVESGWLGQVLLLSRH